MQHWTPWRVIHRCFLPLIAIKNALAVSGSSHLRSYQVRALLSPGACGLWTTQWALRGHSGLNTGQHQATRDQEMQLVTMSWVLRTLAKSQILDKWENEAQMTLETHLYYLGSLYPISFIGLAILTQVFLTVSSNINTDYTGITLEWLKWTGICSLMDGHRPAPDTG